MADHIHACNVCSCRWDCEAEVCQYIPRGTCFWCLASRAGYAGQPQISHDHKWAGGKSCSICKVYKRAKIERLLRLATSKS